MAARREVSRAANVASMAGADGEPTRVSRRALLGASVVGVAGLLTGCEGSRAGTRRPSSSANAVPSRSTGRAPTVVPTASSAPMVVQTGLARLIADDCRVLRGRKVGVLTNPTGVTASFESVVDVLHSADGVELRAVFGPEHGFRGTAQAGRSERTAVDPRTGLTVYDLYGLTSASMADVFDRAGVDTIVFDIQDVGARFYTYVWTLFDVMAAAAASGRRVVVLDRPNPLGGVRVAGPMLRPELESGVGRAPMPQQHGMTVGELATLLAREFLADGRRLELQVVTMTGWRRDRPGDMGGLHWVAPSPNLPTATSTLVYVGTCYFEGTNLSQGRGTTQPFELIGAPYVDQRWTAALRAARLRGAAFREAAFSPTSDAYRGQVCRGVQTYVTDPVAFDAVRTAVTMLTTLHTLYDAFDWRYDTGDTVDPYWIDKLSGSRAVRLGVDAGHAADRIVASWSDELARFAPIRARYLRYP
jgi:uncharacterized protein YbbC (DUF1343 family)